MKKSIIAIIAVVIIIVVIFSLSSSQKSDEAGEPAVNQEAGSSTATEIVEDVWVETYRVKQRDYDIYIAETGITAPIQSVVISSEASGRILWMNAELGQRVGKNELIARIDDELVSLALDQAKAQLINAEAIYEKAGKDLERYKILLEREEVSEGEFETIRLQHELAKSTALSSRAAVKTAERQVKNTLISSPLSGEIAEKNIEEGNMVSIGQPVVKVVDISSVKVKINLSERDIGGIRKGMEVQVRVDAFPEESFKGKVSGVSPEAVSSSHTFPVEIIIPNNQGSVIKSGMIARVNITTETIKNAVFVPIDAIVERFGKSYIYVAAGNKAEERIVTPGHEIEDTIQIVSGVNAGEDVIVVGQFNLENGTPIKIR